MHFVLLQSFGTLDSLTIKLIIHDLLYYIFTSTVVPIYTINYSVTMNVLRPVASPVFNRESEWVQFYSAFVANGMLKLVSYCNRRTHNIKMIFTDAFSSNYMMTWNCIVIDGVVQYIFDQFGIPVNNIDLIVV